MRNAQKHFISLRLLRFVNDRCSAGLKYQILDIDTCTKRKSYIGYLFPCGYLQY